jgi:hypothetical protein
MLNGFVRESFNILQHLGFFAVVGWGGPGRQPGSERSVMGELRDFQY